MADVKDILGVSRSAPKPETKKVMHLVSYLMYAADLLIELVHRSDHEFGTKLGSLFRVVEIMAAPLSLTALK